MKKHSLSVLIFCIFTALLAAQIEISKSYEFEPEPDHLVPTLWEGYGLGRESIIQFFSGGGMRPPIGWCLDSAKNSFRITIYEYGLNEEESRYEIISEKSVLIDSPEWIERVFSVWASEILKTRYPKTDDDLWIERLDGWTSQYVVFVDGLGHIRGESFSSADDTIPGLMNSIGTKIYYRTKTGVLNSPDTIVAIEDLVTKGSNK